MTNSENTDPALEAEDPWAEAMDEQNTVEEKTETEEDPWAEAMDEQTSGDVTDQNVAAEETTEEEDPWAEAMDEQSQESATGENPINEDTVNRANEQTIDNPTEKETAGMETPRTETMAPQAPAQQGAPSMESAGAKVASDQVFKPLNKGPSNPPPRDLEMIMDIPVKLNVELGRTKITIKQLLELTQGSVVELEGLAGDPMDIFINDHLIAQGEVVVIDDKYGIRITEIITPTERAQKINR